MSELAALLKQVLPHTKFRTTVGQPGGNGVYLYDGERKVAQVEFEVVP